MKEESAPEVRSHHTLNHDKLYVLTAILYPANPQRGATKTRRPNSTTSNHRRRSAPRRFRQRRSSKPRARSARHSRGSSNAFSDHASSELHPSPSEQHKTRQARRARRTYKAVFESERHASPSGRNEVPGGVRAREAAAVAVGVPQGEEPGGGGIMMIRRSARSQELHERADCIRLSLHASPGVCGRFD